MPVLRAELLKDLLLCGAIVWLLWVPLGRWALSRIGRGNLPDPQALALPLGMGAWGYLILILGLAGALYKTVLILIAALLFLTLRLHRHWKPVNPELATAQLSRFERIFVLVFTAISAAYSGLVLASALAPEVAFDALNVHLPYARDAAASHRISFAPNNWNSSMPALPLMSYITAFLISGLPLAKLFNVVCYLASGGVTYWFARRWWSPLHGAAAALLVWSSPVALYEATTALVDLPLTLYSAVAVFSVLEWTRRQESSYLWLSAATLGLALSCKYHAALWFIPILFILALALSAGGHANAAAVRPAGSGLLADCRSRFPSLAGPHLVLHGKSSVPRSEFLLRQPILHAGDGESGSCDVRQRRCGPFLAGAGSASLDCHFSSRSISWQPRSALSSGSCSGSRPRENPSDPFRIGAGRSILLSLGPHAAGNPLPAAPGPPPVGVDIVRTPGKQPGDRAVQAKTRVCRPCPDSVRIRHELPLGLSTLDERMDRTGTVINRRSPISWAERPGRTSCAGTSPRSTFTTSSTKSSRRRTGSCC